MTKKAKYMAAAALLVLAGACGDDSDVFYSVSYPVVRVEAEVTVPAPEPEPDPEPNPNPDSASGPTGSGAAQETRSDEETTDPVIAQIEAEIVADAPVKAGGGYSLMFTKYNGGRARIDTAGDAGTVAGIFFKTPGTSAVLFYCPEPALEYTCTLSNYTGEDGRSKVLLTVDLTEQYQALYPGASITKAVRREYTSTNAN